mgnify:CR=1 FL=1
MTFSSEQCNKIENLVLENKKYWVPRGYHEWGTLHTLGGVTAFGDRKGYEEILNFSNPLLINNLKEEYEIIRNAFIKLFKCDVVYNDKLAFPGFQIFTCTKEGGDSIKNGGIIHKDYLWEDREIKDIVNIPQVDEEYSATIILSEGVATLNIWDNYPNGLRIITYKRGTITLQDHQLMHQVPYTDAIGVQRVSMQIRGFRVGNVITLYL